MKAAHKKILDTVFSTLEEAKSQVEGVRDEMQEEFDNKSEKWQEGEKGEEFQNHLNELEEGIGALDTAMEQIEASKG